MKRFSRTRKVLLYGAAVAAFGIAALQSVGCSSSNQPKNGEVKVDTSPATNPAPVTTPVNATPNNTLPNIQLGTGETKAGSSDHTMFGGTTSRNMVNTIDRNVPEKIEPDGPATLWKAGLGSRAYGGPIISGGKIFVGTNNESAVARNPRDVLKIKEKILDGKVEKEVERLEPVDRGVLLCFDEKTGKFLWQAVHPKLPSGQVNDWPKEGLCSTPTVEGDRIYYVSNRCTVVCADVNGQASKQAAGVERKGFSDPTDARFIWEYDMMKELNVFPHNMSACSPLIVGDIMFIVTANGVDEGHINIPSPEAPSFIALDKKSGKLLWKKNDPGKDIMHGQWSNPSFAEINGVKQVIFPGGDGWLRSYVPETGELIWKFDCNPKDAVYELGGAGTRSDFIGTPVFHDNKVYIGVGQDPEHTTGIANFFCIAPTKKGDISKTTISGRDKDGKPLDEKPNPNSCEVWRYGGAESAKFSQRDFKFGRTMSSACIVDDIVYISELAGFLHCLNAKTGEHYWQYDTKASIWGSPYYVDGKIFLANDQGDLFVFRHMKEQKVYDEIKAAQNAKDMKEARKLMKEVRDQVSEKYLISKVEFDAPIRSTPIVANGMLYVMTEKTLYAIKCGK
jgi:outer membrane protein assembly factor BamB